MRSGRLSFTTRLFLVIFLLSAVPTVALLGLATWGLRNYVELAGGAGAWSSVGETGRQLFEQLGSPAVDTMTPTTAAPSPALADSALQAAASRHEAELSRSLQLARRWDLVANRLAAAIPFFAVFLGVLLAGLAAWAARELARGLARPVGELVDWSDRLAREEPLPPAGAPATHEPPEFSALKDAFRDTAERLAEGRRQALEAERLRGLTEMARRVAHEIKNPLTPLMLAIRQARTNLARGGTEGLRESLDIIAGEAERLDEMARSFSQLGRLPEGPTSEIDLEELLRRLLASDLPPSVAGRLHAEENLPHVEGHLDALDRAFRNLIGNAVEALGERTDARVDVTLSRADGALEVAVADNGPGVPAASRDRIWDPDFTTKKGGTGLGLALVRQTIRAHGGEVELRGAGAAPGACFIVRLPLKRRTEGPG